MKKIFVGYTKYQLLIFLLLNNILEDKLLIVLSSNMEELKNSFSNICEVKIFNEDKPNLKNFKKFINYYKNYKKFIEEIKADKEDYIYGDSTIAYFNSKKLYLLEDGIGNYVTKAYEKKVSLKGKIYLYLENLIHFFIFKKFKYNFDDIIKKVTFFYITNVAPEDFELKVKKVKRIDLKHLWKEKEKKEKEKILSIFGINEIYLRSFQNKKIILFTQPLSEDNIINEEEKISLYRKVLDNYSKHEVIIKPHPREKTNYLEKFSDCSIMKGNFPSEFLYLEGIKISKVVTLFSTAALTFGKNLEIDFYGTEVNEKIFEKFGNCDKVMKRNAWLKK